MVKTLLDYADRAELEAEDAAGQGLQKNGHEASPLT